jgi:ABC-type nitrate/sulfonate/bicarbonate transport system substrate-binding protein
MISTQFSAQSIKLAVISEGVNSWPLYVAQAQRLFEREDINVETTLTGSSVRQFAQLTRGDFDIGIQQSDHIVRGVESGSDLFVFMAHAHAPELSLVVAPAINSFADLRGRDIAVDGARTGYALLLRKLLAAKGLQDGAYTFREIGGSKERFDSLRAGATFASFLNPPFDRNLFAAGFRSLGTTGEYFPTYPGSIAAARRRWAQQNKRPLIGFICAVNAGYAWLKDTKNKDAAIQLLPARLNIDAKTASRAYDAFVGRPAPAITPEALRQVIDVVWEAEGYNGAKGAPEKYMDLSFLEKAQQARRTPHSKPEHHG